MSVRNDLKAAEVEIATAIEKQVRAIKEKHGLLVSGVDVQFILAGSMAGVENSVVSEVKLRIEY